MEVRCNNCAQRYRIPDHRINNRNVYFHCDRCNGKVVVQGPSDPWTFSVIEADNLLSFTGIFEGIKLSFNGKSNLITLLVHAFLYLCAFSGYILWNENARMGQEHPVFRSIFLLVATSIAFFIVDLNLYLVSKLSFAGLAGNRDFRLSSIREDFPNDLKNIFILSSAFTAVIGLIFLPIIHLGKHGRIIGGAAFPPLFLIMALLLVLLFFKPFLTAFIAMKSRSPFFMMKSMARFLVVENINLFFHLAAILAAVAVVGLFLWGILFAAFAIALLLYSSFSGHNPILDYAGVVTPHLVEVMKGACFSGSTGRSFERIMIAGTGIAALFLVAVFSTTMLQTLSTVSMRIMAGNPGRSVQKKYMTMTLLFVSALCVVFVLFFSTFR